MEQANVIKCPHCGQAYTIAPEQWSQYAGKTINCTRCGQQFAPSATSAAVAGGTPPAFASPPPMGSVGPSPAFASGPPVSNGWATTSLVLGILGFLIPLLPAVGAIIAGIVGLSRAHDPRVRVRGRGMAIAGISLGGVGLVIMTPALLVTLLLPRLSHAREQAQRIKSMSNLRQIGAAAMMYSNENRGYLPSDWAGLFPYVNSPSVFISPRRTASPAIPQDHDQWPQWVDSNSDYVWLGHGKLNFIPNPSGVAMAHEKFDDNPRGINILFCDAHVDYLPLPEARDLIEKSQQTLKQADNDTHH